MGRRRQDQSWNIYDLYLFSVSEYFFCNCVFFCHGVRHFMPVSASFYVSECVICYLIEYLFLSECVYLWLSVCFCYCVILSMRVCLSVSPSPTHLLFRMKMLGLESFALTLWKKFFSACMSVDSELPTRMKTSASKQCWSIHVSKSGDTSIPGESTNTTSS